MKTVPFDNGDLFVIRKGKETLFVKSEGRKAICSVCHDTIDVDPDLRFSSPREGTYGRGAEGEVVRKHVVLMSVLAVMVLSMVTACATKYTHSKKPSSQFAKDERDCEVWAEKEAARKTKAGQACVVCEEVDRCLVQQKGWKVVR